MADVERALMVAQAWMDRPDVVAVGHGEQDGAPAINVYISVPGSPEGFPSSVEGVPVVVRDAGGPIIVQTDDGDPASG